MMYDDISNKHKEFKEKLAFLANRPLFYDVDIVAKPKPSLPKPKKRIVQSIDSSAVMPLGELPSVDTSIVEAPLVKVPHIVPPSSTYAYTHTIDPLPCPIIDVYKVGTIIDPACFKHDLDFKDLRVYRLGDNSLEERAIMTHIGLDIGTKTIVLAFGGKTSVEYIAEINGYWPIEKSTPFMENMLSDPKKKRSDGTERPARFIKLEDGRLILLGRDAEEFAYSMNDTLKRPMAEGGITPDEDSITVLASIIHGILETAEKEVGKFDSDLKICYCTTAKAINNENNIDYHSRIVDMILKNYETKSNLKFMSIKESHAIVNNMSPDGSGIGVSWGAGTVTVSYVKYGIEVFSFCWVGSGDWIDDSVARRYGYDPERSKLKGKVSKETPTTVAKRKMEVDLTPGNEPTDRVGLDIVLHYDVLIDNVIKGIVTGFIENESQARIDSGVNIYMAGGTSSPKGFIERVKKKFEEVGTPFDIGKIIRHKDPLFCVAEGCQKAALTL
jgi:hypothetical protein